MKLNSPPLFFSALALAYFVLNLFLVSSSIYGGDSGDLVTAAYVFGIPHPPGYPLYTLLTGIILQLVDFKSPAFVANLNSAIYHALTLFILLQIIFRLTKNIAASLLATLILGSTYLFLFYSHIAEVFPLSNLLAASAIYFLILWREKFNLKFQTKEQLNLMFSAFFLGIGIFHHQTLVMLLPAFIYLTYKTYPKLFKDLKLISKLLLIFLSGAISYLYAPIAAGFNPPINWDDPSNLPGLIRLVLRADYGTFQSSGAISGNFMERIAQFAAYFQLLRADFGLFGIGLAFLGFVYLFKTQKTLFKFFFLAWLLTGPFFLFYASFPLSGSFGIGVLERFMLLGYLPATIVLGFGINWIFILANEFVKNLKINFRLTAVVIFCLISAWPLFLLITNFAKTNLSNFTLGDVVANDVLVTPEEGAIVFLHDDTLIFNSQYLHYVKSFRPDLILIMGGPLQHTYYRRQLKQRYPNLDVPLEGQGASGAVESGLIAKELVRRNFDKFPIYAFDAGPAFPDKSWVQIGLMQRLFLNDILPDAGNYQQIAKPKLENYQFKSEMVTSGYKHLIPVHIAEIYMRHFTLTAYEFYNRNLFEDAQIYFQKSLEINPEYDKALFGLALNFEKIGECDKAIDYFNLDLKINPNDVYAYEGLERVIRDCQKDPAKADEIKKRLDQIKEKLRNQTPLETF